MSHAKFWARVNKRGALHPTLGTRCWNWTGLRRGGATKGYGVYGNTGAHRHAWTITKGAIPAGLFVLHKCDKPPCVNPDHLFLGTHLDNMRDMIAKSRHRNLSEETRRRQRKDELRKLREPTPTPTAPGAIILVRYGMGTQIAQVVGESDGELVVRKWNAKSATWSRAMPVSRRDLRGVPTEADLKRRKFAPPNEDSAFQN